MFFNIKQKHIKFIYMIN